MSFFKRNYNWLIALCAMSALLWTAQLSADWYKPASEIGLGQHKKTEIAHNIQFDSHENSRAFKLESETDPVADHAALTVLAACDPGFTPRHDTAAARIKSLTFDLPAIRAPPHHLQTA